MLDLNGLIAPLGRFSLVRLRRWMCGGSVKAKKACGTGISRRAALALTASVAGATQADAAFWLRVKAPVAGALSPITATIPAHYANIAGMPSSQWHAPQPVYSIGINGSASSQVMLDNSLASQAGGLGKLTDDLSEYTAPDGTTYGAGDAAGFSVTTAGELVLSDYLAYISRGSGSVRKMYWVQVLGPQTLRQPITITLDPTKARTAPTSSFVTANRRRSNDSSTLAYYQCDVLDSDCPVVSIHPSVAPPVAGITFPVGPSDADILAGKMKKAGTVNPTTGVVTLHPYLLGSAGARSATLAWRKENGDPISVSQDTSGAWFTPSASVGRALDLQPVPTLIPTTNTSGNLRIIEYFDFRGFFFDQFTPAGYIFRNCLFDYSCFVPYLNYKTGGPTQSYPDNAFVLENVRYADGTGADRTKLTADNIADFIQVSKNVGFSTPSTSASVGKRNVVPSMPGSQGDALFNPFRKDGQGAFIVGWDDVNNTITISVSSPSTAPLPANLRCIVGPHWRVSGVDKPDRYTSPASLFVCVNQPSFEYCRVDCSVPGHKFGMTSQDVIPFTNAGFGPKADANGIFRGARYNAVVNTPQDSIDCPNGYMGYNLFTSSGRADGSHVDGLQIPGVNRLPPNLKAEFNYWDNCGRFVDQTNFVDPIIDGATTNATILSYAGTGDVASTRVHIGGLDAALYFEMNKETNRSYGSAEMANNILRCSVWGIEVVRGRDPTAKIFLTNPLCISSTNAAVSLNTLSNPTSASLQTSPGMAIPDESNVMFNPILPGETRLAFFNSSLDPLPSVLLPNKVYALAAYSIADFTLSASGNNTANLQVGDLLALDATGAGFQPGDTAATASMTAVVTEIDGGTAGGAGMATKIAVAYPGKYKYRPTATTMSVRTAQSSSASGKVTIVFGSVTFMITDLTGATIDGSAISGTYATVPHKQFQLGRIAFHDNWFGPDSTMSGSISATSYIKDPQGYKRNGIDIVSIYGNRWLFGAPQYAPVESASGLPLVPVAGFAAPSSTLPEDTASISPPPSMLDQFSIAATGTNKIKMAWRVKTDAGVALDTGARISPDSYPITGTYSPRSGSQTYSVPSGYTPVNSSGYRYRITPTSTGVVGAWKSVPTAPSTLDTTRGAVEWVDTDLQANQSYTIEAQAVANWNQPNLEPTSFPVNNNSATVTMLAV